MTVLDRKDYQHEKDGRLIKRVLENKSVDTVMDFLKKNRVEDIYMYVYRSSYLPVTPQSSPRLCQLVKKAAALLGLNETPEVFLVRDYDSLITIGGLSAPFLLISTELLDMADEKTLFGLIASRMAGIRVGHHRALFLEWVLSAAGSQLPMPVVAALGAVINDWKRCCYLTYDRAFYQVTRDVDLTFAQILMPVIGPREAAAFRLKEKGSPFREQVAFFYGAGAAEGVFKLMNDLSSDQPWMPERYQEMEKYLKEAGAL